VVALWGLVDAINHNGLLKTFTTCFVFAILVYGFNSLLGFLLITLDEWWYKRNREKNYRKALARLTAEHAELVAIAHDNYKIYKELGDQNFRWSAIHTRCEAWYLESDTHKEFMERLWRSE
jgi:hypothetical protein